MNAIPDKLVINQVELNNLNRSVLFSEKTIDITGLEFNLLSLLMANAGEVISRGDIAKKVFNLSEESCNKSINSHMTNLRKKLSAGSEQPVIKTIRGQGYMFIKMEEL